MISPFKKTLSVLVLGAIIIVSFVGICTQTFAACGMDCTTMSAVHVGTQTGECAHDSAACSTSMPDHMATFASLYPAAAASGFLFLLISSVALFFTLLHFAKRDTGAEERLRAKYKSLKQKLIRALAPDFLVAAFSRGILNAKIYA